MGYSITSSFGRLLGALKSTTTRTHAVPRNAGAEEQRRAAIGLKNGYSAHDTPAGPIYTADTPEAGYFVEEREYAPTIMTVESPSMAGPNSAHARRARFEDPAEEFTNAGPKVSHKPIDYSIFTVRADTVPAQPTHVKEDLFETPKVMEFSEDTSTKVEEAVVTEIPAPIEITPIQESIREEPVVETAPAEPEVEVAPVETPVVEVSDIDETEESPAAEITASTAVFGGVAGVGMAKTSIAIPMPVVPIFLNDETEAVRLFDPVLDFDANECELTLEDSDIPEDGMEKTLAEDIEIEEFQAALEMEAEAAPAEVEVAPVETPVIDIAPVEEPVVEIAPVEEAEIFPVCELADVEEVPVAYTPIETPVTEEPVIEIAPAEESVEFFPVGELADVEEVPVAYIPTVEAAPVEEPELFPVCELADVEEVPVDYTPTIEAAPVEEVPAIPAPAQVFCLPPAGDVKFIEAPSEPVIEVKPAEEPVEFFPVGELADVEEVPVAYTPAVEIAPAEEPVIEVAAVEVSEEPVIDMTAEEEPVVEIAPVERKAEPSIIRRSTVDPADVAAILFGL